MRMTETFSDGQMPSGFHWFNEPASFSFGAGLEMRTRAETDFWQSTHYGFRRDDGHCLLTRLDGDFCLSTHAEFEPRTRYDQCGLIVRLDHENWIKASTEYEDEACSRLGSVVTNLGYSDWATQDIPSKQREMWYRISKNGQDFLIENSCDGKHWVQQRIAHLHRPAVHVLAGVYACSPIGRDFCCRFSFLSIGENSWS